MSFALRKILLFLFKENKKKMIEKEREKILTENERED